MKEWLTAREIAAENLPFIPGTERGVQKLASRENWDQHPFARQRQGHGGGMEYRYMILPATAQMAYVSKYQRIGVEAGQETPEDALGDVKLNAREKRERDARVAILRAFEDFATGMRARSRTLSGALHHFSIKYNNRSLQVEDWVREAVPSISPRTLARWRSKAKKGLSELAFDRGAARAGTGVLETANEGKVRARILGLMASAPQLAAGDVLTQVRSEFGDTLTVFSKGDLKTVKMPSIRTFQMVINALKEKHKVELLKLTNPDQYRSTMLPSGRGMYADIKRPNQLWQIDASPTDALCTDGRHSVYVCVDIASRRMLTYMSKTPRASAVGLLIRKAILAWGVPKVIKTDNGSDFVAHETKTLFAALGIDPDPSDAYSPAQKGHVERAIRTWQHGFVTLLPGYVGHNVAERKAIEDRKSFAERLGQDTAEAFNVQYTAAEFQERSDRWCLDKYQHTEHSGLEGLTPFRYAASAEYTVSRVDERALDALLMPVARNKGRCTVTKFGIRINHHHYRPEGLLTGQSVFVRMDPNDAGRAHVFSLDQTEYLCLATCPELAGIHPQTFEKARKELHAQQVKERIDPIKAEIKKITSGPSLIDRALEVAARDIPNVIALPKREEKHSTPQIAAALDAMDVAEGKRTVAEDAGFDARVQQVVLEDLTPKASGENVAAIRAGTTPSQRFHRARALRARMDAGIELLPEEAFWLGSYEGCVEWKVQKALFEDFGDQAPVPSS